MYKSLAELAKELGVTRATVYRHARRMGIGGYSDANDGRLRLFDEQQQKQLREVILREKHYPKAQ